MQSSASRAAKGMISARRACDEPNRSFVSDARNDPRSCAASSGNVIMHRASNARWLHHDHGSMVASQFEAGLEHDPERGCPTLDLGRYGFRKRPALRLDLKLADQATWQACG